MSALPGAITRENIKTYLEKLNEFYVSVQILQPSYENSDSVRLASVWKLMPLEADTSHFKITNETSAIISLHKPKVLSQEEENTNIQPPNTENSNVPSTQPTSNFVIKEPTLSPNNSTIPQGDGLDTESEIDPEVAMHRFFVNEEYEETDEHKDYKIEFSPKYDKAMSALCYKLVAALQSGKYFFKSKM